MYSQGHDSGYDYTWSMWNTNLKFLKDGKYLIELTYIFYKVDDRRNSWDIDDNVFGSQGYISFNDNIIESNLDFVYRNGYYSGLIEEPTVNGNNKVPLIHKALIPVTVVNGNCTIEDEHLQKTNVLTQDLTYKSIYANNKYEVKYSSNNISFNWLINYKGINFNEYRQDFSNQFLYPSLDPTSTVNEGQFLLHLAIMSGWYDGTGNYNDWLMAFLLQYCIYPVPKECVSDFEWNGLIVDKMNKSDVLIALSQVTTKEQFDKLFNSLRIKQMIVNDILLMRVISQNDNILNIMYNHYKKKLSGAGQSIYEGHFIILEVSKNNYHKIWLSTSAENECGEVRLSLFSISSMPTWNNLKGKFQCFKQYPSTAHYIRNDSQHGDEVYVYYYDFGL